jgi:hypothetical protein
VTGKTPARCWRWRAPRTGEAPPWLGRREQGVGHSSSWATTGDLGERGSSKERRVVGERWGRRSSTPGRWDERLCWGPSASEGPQKRDLIMFSKYASRYLQNQVAGIQKHGQDKA